MSHEIIAWKPVDRVAMHEQIVEGSELPYAVTYPKFREVTEIARMMRVAGDPLGGVIYALLDCKDEYRRVSGSGESIQLSFEVILRAINLATFHESAWDHHCKALANLHRERVFLWDVRNYMVERKLMTVEVYFG